MNGRDFEGEVLALATRLKERACRFTNNADRADDLVQETLLRAWQAWPGSDVQNVWGWLALIMRNTWFSHLRAAKFQRDQVQKHRSEIAELRSTAPRAPDASVTSGPDDDLREAMKVLTPAQRAVLDLQLLGIDDQSTARHLRINLKTVRTTACKARSRMRAIL